MTPPPLSDEQIYNLVWKEQLEQEALAKAVAAMRDAQWEGHNALQYVSDFGQMAERGEKLLIAIHLLEAIDAYEFGGYSEELNNAISILKELLNQVKPETDCA